MPTVSKSHDIEQLSLKITWKQSVILFGIVLNLYKWLSSFIFYRVQGGTLKWKET